MDLSIYLNMMISAAWYLIPIYIFTVIIKSAWFKGILGEWQVNFWLHPFGPNTKNIPIVVLISLIMINKEEHHD
ncbi:MAG: hypothetical protein V7736_07670 [Colwellia polaris]|jgi:hypothetical protein|uniref:hypothetical protein n=1 Tax=Colwellia polaris TaxID=326537 RepID=UPI001E4898C3|nr:hypothetical protein [Colwellia polaris]|tara:strand:+ start:1088 stop:1309 length:222 start_codon:yes stop_codon:yes gene_type:complete